ncbi:MAG TPA: cupin domain-containing protein [Syntrophales bacterium]|nr:cupin domain-containing protein [Syntrophales bacterium]HQN78337.1 cupin domain-containing protein [Syntrophales bacterium]
MKRDKKEIFPEPVTALPEADIPLKGVKAYLSQADRHQIIFMTFEEDVDLPEHSHAAQAGFVLEGKIEMVLDGERKTFTKGDRYYIPAGMRHSGKIFAGYADITFFDEPGRYGVKPRKRD